MIEIANQFDAFCKRLYAECGITMSDDQKAELKALCDGMRQIETLERKFREMELRNGLSGTGGYPRDWP